MFTEKLALVKHFFQNADQALLAGQCKQEALTTTTSYKTTFRSLVVS